VLTVAGVALVAVPLLKKKPVEYSPAPWAALVAAGVLAIGSTVLYVRWTNWSWQTKAADENSPQTMVARLARKLEKNPEDLNGWLLLGRSYSVLQQYQLAVRAYQRADRLAGGKNADALIGQAEALALSDETELDGRAGRLVEQALALDPESGKALFFGAAAAMRRGELPVARARFVKLLSLNPPDNIKPLLQKQIEAIDQRMAAGPAQDADARPAGQPQVAAATDTGAKVRINVTLAPSLAQSASGSLDSMLPGRAIAAGQKVQVVARIARSGNPVGASGDPFGESAYMVGRDGLINIVIDRVTP
jgi:cytochrome c-type biogenesis protein CcmH